jgi:two-component system, chemotaxis family, chemotaxis protein CheY
MIVDDSRIMRRQIAESARRSGLHHVGSAANGRQALELFRRERPQLITMDITMPEMDGIECVAAIMAIDPTVSILVVSALADKATAIEALKQGARGFLCKPVTEAQLLDAFYQLTQCRVTAAE